MIDGFYWLVDGLLAGCPLPGGRRRGAWGNSPRPAEPDDALGADLDWLREQGIGAILTLTEDALPGEALAERTLVVLHLPVPDLTAPSREQLQQALAFIDQHTSRGVGVAVHCLVGQGRTGTVLAAYLIRGGAGVEDAIEQVRARRPGSIESPAQVRALRVYAAGREWFV